MGHSMDQFAVFFQKSLVQEQKRGRWAFVGFLVASLTALGLYLWRCQFGVDLTDEAFYLMPAWKLFPLGDRPFLEEFYNAPRHSDLLNQLLVAPWLPYNVLTLRRAAVILYAVILGAFVVKAFRKNLGLMAALTFIGCLTFDYFFVPTWSYNWWARNFLLLHHLALFVGLSKAGRARTLGSGFAGLFLGSAAVAYNPLVVALPVAWFLLWRSGKKSSSPPFDESKVLRIYALAALMPLFLDFAYIWQAGLLTPWLAAFHKMRSISDYSVSHIQKALGILGYLFKRRDLWVILGAMFVFHADAVWTLSTAKFNWTQRRWVRRATLSLFVGYLIFRAPDLRDPNSLLSLFICLGFAGTIIVWIWASRLKETSSLIVVAVTAVASLLMAVSSANDYIALFWVLPGAIVPFVALIHSEANLRASARSQKRVWEERHGQWVLAGFLVLLLGGNLFHQKRRTYFDVSTGNATAEVSVPPLQGLRTSGRRAYLVERLSQILANETFAIAYADIPGAFWFGKVRPSVDTVMVEPLAPEALNEHSLRTLRERNRLPSVILATKVDPWRWGMGRPPERFVSPGHPFAKFTNCVSGGVIVEEEEFAIYRVDQTKIDECLPGQAKVAAN